MLLWQIKCIFFLAHVSFKSLFTASAFSLTTTETTTSLIPDFKYLEKVIIFPDISSGVMSVGKSFVPTCEM